MNPFDNVMKIHQQQPPPPPAPPKPTKRMTAAAYAEGNWTYWVTLTPSGQMEPVKEHNALVVAGQLERVVKLLEDVVTKLNRLAMHVELIDLNSRKPPAVKPPTKADREKASRDRAMAAYVKASRGGDPDVLAMRLSVLRLSVRAENCLLSMGINTVGEIVVRSESELLEGRNFGSTSLREVRARLAELGLQLRGDVPGEDDS